MSSPDQSSDDPLSRDVPLPGQDDVDVDLDPTVEPEPQGSAENEPAAAGEDPEGGNALIRPDNS